MPMFTVPVVSKACSWQPSRPARDQSIILAETDTDRIFAFSKRPRRVRGRPSESEHYCKPATDEASGFITSSFISSVSRAADLTIQSICNRALVITAEPPNLVSLVSTSHGLFVAFSNPHAQPKSPERLITGTTHLTILVCFIPTKALKASLRPISRAEP